MPINIGTSGVKEIYVGGAPVSAVYAGTSLVWQRRKKTDVLKGYFDYLGFTTWEGATSVTAPELGVSWTVAAIVPAGKTVTIGGVALSNTGGTVKAAITSNRATMTLQKSSVSSPTPVVMVCASKDWYGYRARMWVDGVDVATDTNGGALKGSESTQGGSVSAAPEWAAFKVGVEQGDVHNGGDSIHIKAAIWYGVVGVANVAVQNSPNSFTLPAMSDYQWVTACWGGGGNALTAPTERGGGAGQAGIVRHGYGTSLKAGATSSSTVFAGEYSYAQGEDGAMPTWRGEDAPDLRLPWGEVSKGDKSPTGIDSAPHYRRAGSGGSAIKDNGGKYPQEITRGGYSRLKVWLSI